jgi:predicted RNA-binding Zn-ribbon protein involved in translation (DUF1610 family)
MSEREVAGTVRVGDAEVEFYEEPLPDDLVGAERLVYDSGGKRNIYNCPRCGGLNLMYNFLCYRPALAWACTSCGYSEHPPLRHVIEGTAPEKIESDWEILIFPKEWVTHHAVYDALETLIPNR